MRRVVLAVVSIVVGQLACSSDATSSGGSGGPFVARFAATSAQPNFLDVPFPSDVYLQGGKFGPIPGMDRVFPQSSDFIVGQLQRTTGWSRIAPAVFALDDTTKPANTDTGEASGAEIDRASLPADADGCKADGSSVFFVDLEATDPASARLGCRANVDDERQAASGRTLLTIGPARGLLLAEGHRYAAVVTSRVKDTGGHALASTSDFAAAKTHGGAVGQVYGDAVDKVTSLLGGALAGTSIVAIAPYTTQKTTQDLYDLRDALEAAPAATLAWDDATVAPMKAAKFANAGAVATLPAGFTASLDDWLGVATKKLPDGTDDPDEDVGVPAHDKIDAVGTAVFTATNYLQKRPNKYDDLDHGTFARDGSGKVVPAPEAPTAKIWVTFAIPTGPMPAGGFPAVIVQHGLSGSRQYLLSLANTFCKKGWIAVAIDSVTFGARASDPKFLVDSATDYTGKGAKYQGGDGISDLVNGERAGSYDMFGSLKNIRAFGDQLAQASFDTAQLVKLLRSDPDLSPLRTGITTAKIDPDHIAYVGDSLGGIEGATAAAIEPHVVAWTLEVAGGGIVLEAGAHGPIVNSNLAIAGSLNFGLRGAVFGEFHPLVSIGQTLMEQGDPIAFADRIVKKPAPLAGAPTKPRNVFQIEVLYDELVANEADEALAVAAGYGMATPNVGANSGASDKSGKPYPTGGITITQLTPDGAGFHDTPQPGVTALVAQVSPASHGSDLVRSTGDRQYLIPFNTPEGGFDPVRIDKPVSVPQPYRALQASMIGFFGDAFADKVPTISGLPPPVRDLDGDGKPDESDPSPLDPSQ
jgi:dienelactone hydrolase